jgi:hypothetical protein
MGSHRAELRETPGVLYLSRVIKATAGPTLAIGGKPTL